MAGMYVIVKAELIASRNFKQGRWGVIPLRFFYFFRLKYIGIMILPAMAPGSLLPGAFHFFHSCCIPVFILFGNGAAPFLQTDGAPFFSICNPLPATGGFFGNVAGIGL
ncbi:MAG: hypothetical protein P4L75_06950 [Clostridia bacterium]|nr:hypothetical protein [Clostridia bacterium]